MYFNTFYKINQAYMLADPLCDYSSWLVSTHEQDIALHIAHLGGIYNKLGHLLITYIFQASHKPQTAHREDFM